MRWTGKRAALPSTVSEVTGGASKQNDISSESPLETAWTAR
jgi:hypothetical protein